MSIDDDIALLERVPTFGLLGRAALRVLAIGAEAHRIEAGDTLFMAGEPADAGYVVQHGSFSLLPDTRDDSRKIIAGRGSLLGELALMAQGTRPATATALEPSSVIRISRTLFLKMLDGYPDAATKLRDSLIARTEQSSHDLERLRTVFAKDDGNV